MARGSVRAWTGKMIDFGKQTEVPVRDLVLELLEFVDDVVDELGSRKEIEHVHTILERGTSADRQLQVYRETNDLKAVVDDLIKLTMENVPETTQVWHAEDNYDGVNDCEVTEPSAVAQASNSTEAHSRRD